MLSHDPYNVRSEAMLFRSEIMKYISKEQDVNLLVSIFKHISLYNILIELNVNLNHKNHVKGIVYDALNSLVALLNKRERYLHLNLRSMIEHIARIALNKTYHGDDFDGTVRRKDFDFLKKNKSEENWQYMHNVYTNACYFVHFSPKANLNISAKFLQLLTNDLCSPQSKLISNLHKVSSAIMKTFLVYFHGDVGNTFFRAKTDLKFLLGNSLYSNFLSRE
ncbi:hypothetical protein ACONXG_000576 [Yersinia enterocolitica]|nr:hypothetical protein [Yersinia enterocolitica]EKN5118390.1 hypothetical protein [Yersinia enterocolitica]